MPIFSAFVVYAFVWFITLLVVLALRNEPQAESGHVEPGTPASAPSNARMRWRLMVTTIVATIVWAMIAAVVISGVLTVEDIDVFNRWYHG